MYGLVIWALHSKKHLSALENIQCHVTKLLEEEKKSCIVQKDQKGAQFQKALKYFRKNASS